MDKPMNPETLFSSQPFNEGPAIPKWHDVGTAEEFACALDLRAAKAAKAGDYDSHAELSDAAACIRDLAEQLENA